MKELENLKELYLEELKKINKKGDLTPADSEAAIKALDALKKIDELCCQEDEMEQGQYSQRRHSMGDWGQTHRMPEMNYIPQEYPYYNDGYAQRRGRNQRTGQYMSRDGYSRHDDTVDNMIDKLEYMRMDAPDHETRKAIDRCIDKLENR